jgi:glutamate-1-semialdehyde 2,1-aminomutase
MALPVNSSWQNRAELSIAHGALTNSKRPECLVKGVYPTHLTSGTGCLVKDPDGKQYIDFICGLGSTVLGHSHPEVATAISTRAFHGASLPLGSILEVETAEKVKEVIPFIDRLRFLKTGTDACVAALRIARTATRRHKVLTEGYHGWSDEFVSLTPPAFGVSGAYPIEKFTELSQIDHETAAVILEPIQTELSDARIQWLRELRQRCTETGVLLIFDEVITGFRMPKFTFSQTFGITPDLICLGKAMASGMPLAVVGGARTVMEAGEYFVSSTFAGETLSLAAGMKTLTLLQTKYSLADLWERGAIFQREFNSYYPGSLWIEGYPTRGVFKGDPLVKALFWQEACRAGILFGPSFFFGFQHQGVTDAVLSSCRDILTRIRCGGVKLDGEMPQTPFAQRQRS